MKDEKIVEVSAAGLLKLAMYNEKEFDRFNSLVDAGKIPEAANLLNSLFPEVKKIKVKK